MQINLETPDNHSIQAYTATEIKINEMYYQQSLIISREAIIKDWPIRLLQELSETTLAPLIQLKPEIILIGHNEKMNRVPVEVLQYLSQQRIGFECMSIGAASRTFNVLLSEQRAVLAGIIF